MRLKILLALLSVLAAVVISLEYQYSYIYWSLVPRPAVPHLFLEEAASSDESSASTKEGEQIANESRAKTPGEPPAKVHVAEPMESEQTGN